MAMAENVHIPASSPASAPQVTVVSAGLRNIARLADISNENTAVKPNILPLLLFCVSSMVRLLAAIQAVPNTLGEYQRPPTINADRAATTTAGQLISAGFIQFKLSFSL